MDTFFSLIKEIVKHHKFGVFLIILALLFDYYTNKNDKALQNDKEYWVKYYRELEYHIRVTDYSNWMGDLDVYGYGSNGKKVYYCISRSYLVVQKGFQEGDSIAKEYGSLELKVIRKDTVISLLPVDPIIQEYLLDNDSIKS